MTTTENPIVEQPITVKQAVRAALQYVADLYEDKNIYDVLLEEVEHEDGYWYITVGFTRPVYPRDLGSLRNLADAINLTEGTREYKIIQVDERTGKPVSMKIRPDE